MNKDEFKLQHPEIFTAAVQTGINQERERVSAHLVLGNQSGDMKTAIGAIKDGSELTALIHATHMAASMNRGDIEARRDDDKDSAGAADPAGAVVDGDADSVVALVEQKLGIGS